MTGKEVAAVAGGRPLGYWVHYVALSFAAFADVAAFYQVVSVVMRYSPAAVNVLLVLGLTAITLYLTHSAGQALKERAVDSRRAAGWIAAACLGVWFPLGLAAFWARHAAPLIRRETPTQHLTSAVLFLALYLGTGAVAVIGAYLTHNPAVSGYLAALRRHRRQTKRVARRQRTYEAVRCTIADRRRDIEVQDRQWEAAREARRALAEGLKQEVRVFMAAYLQDPAATDGLLSGRPRRRPRGAGPAGDQPLREPVELVRPIDVPDGQLRLYDFGPVGEVLVDRTQPVPVVTFWGDRPPSGFLDLCRTLSLDAGDGPDTAIVVVDGHRIEGAAAEVIAAVDRRFGPAQVDQGCDFIRLDTPAMTAAFHRMPPGTSPSPILISCVTADPREVRTVARWTAAPRMRGALDTVVSLELPGGHRPTSRQMEVVDVGP